MSPDIARAAWATTPMSSGHERRTSGRIRDRGAAIGQLEEQGNGGAYLPELASSLHQAAGRA